MEVLQHDVCRAKRHEHPNTIPDTTCIQNMIPMSKMRITDVHCVAEDIISEAMKKQMRR